MNARMTAQEIVLDLFAEGQLVVVMYFMPHSPECAVRAALSAPTTHSDGLIEVSLSAWSIETNLDPLCLGMAH